MTRGVFVALAFAMPVAADAPISGPDRQYERFTGESTSIEDRFTKLIWDRPGTYAQSMSFEDAVRYCDDGTRRLPTLKELLTLVDEEPHEEYDLDRRKIVARSIDQQAFPGTPAEEFWTSSTGLDGKVRTVDFANGTTGSANPNNNDKRRVRCVEARPAD